MTDQEGTRAQRDLERALNKDAKIALAALVAAMVAVWAYWFAFKTLPLGGPNSWASFGDYFGGLINPIVGIVTVLLVVRTLHTTRKEAQDTREKLVEQIALTERQLVLSEMHKRLDGLYSEWLRISQRGASNVVRVGNDGHLQEAGAMSAYAALNDPTFQGDAKRVLLGNSREPYRNAWRKSYELYAELLREFALYCDQYEEEAQNTLLSDYYRRRVFMAATTLKQMDVLSDVESDRLRPKSLRGV